MTPTPTARALWDADADRDRAVSLSREALAVFEPKAETHGDTLAEVRAWLGERDAER